MKFHLRLFLLLVLPLLAGACSSTATPFGTSTKLGTDTAGYVAGRNVRLANGQSGMSITADELLIVDRENQSESFRSVTSLGATVARWYLGTNALKSLGNSAAGWLKTKEVTAQNASNNAAAVEQARVAAEVKKAALEAEPVVP